MEKEPVEPVIEKIPGEERTWAMIAHLAALAWFLPFGNVVGPLIVWLIKKNTMPFVADQGKEVLNFNISILIYAFISALLTVIVIGIPLLLIVFLFWLYFTIKGAVSADKGVRFRYPLTIRFLK